MVSGFTRRIEDSVRIRKCPVKVVAAEDDCLLDFDSPIYRYVSKTRYLELIEKKVNSLSHFSNWEDPYEAYLFRAAISMRKREGGDERGLYNKYKLIYGQSWTLDEDESDLLWRANGTRGDVVRIKSTIRKLFNTFVAKWDGSSNAEPLNLRIGNVEYVDQDDMRIDMANCDFEGELENNMDSFFRKRREFAGERELRCVVVVRDEECLDKQTDENGSLLRFKLNSVDDFIDEVLLDPCMSRRDCEQVICRTLHQSQIIKVEQSNLFAWPDVGDDDAGRAAYLRTGFASLVKLKLLKVLKSNAVTDEELVRLCDLGYSHETFGLSYPLLTRDIETASSERYWKDVYLFHGNEFRVCNDWKKNRHERRLRDWLNLHHSH